jgi:hypothetical protein
MLQDHVGRITYMQVIVIVRLRLQQLREMCAGFSFTRQENQHRSQAKKLIPPKPSCIGLPKLIRRFKLLNLPNHFVPAIQTTPHSLRLQCLSISEPCRPNSRLLNPNPNIHFDLCDDSRSSKSRGEHLNRQQWKTSPEREI